MKPTCFLCLIIIFFTLSCKRTEEAPQSTIWKIVVPSNLGGSLPQPAGNPVTEKGVALGRKLFSDPILSGSNKIACTNCHMARFGFSDGIALSDQGAAGHLLVRKSSALINLAWMQKFFWDGGASDLEFQAISPIESPEEMNQNIQELIDELNQIPEYNQAFEEAFGSEGITPTTITKALAQFERTLISAGSKYDRYIRKEGELLNESELKGLRLYEEHCSRCHQSDLFTDNDFHNNGLDSVFNFPEDDHRMGRFRISHIPDDIGKFKTPTLRNLSFTFPYMHDGRFNTIHEVLNHYSEGIKASPTLDPGLKGGLKLSEEEKACLIAFLNTLNDYDFISGF